MESKRWWRRAFDWCGRAWGRLKPGREAKRGAIWALIAAALAHVVIAGIYIHLGYGYFFDFAFSTLAAAIIIGIAMASVALLFTLARKLTRKTSGFVLGLLLIISIVWGPPQLGFAMAAAFGASVACLGAGIAMLRTQTRRMLTMGVLLITGLAGTGAMLWLLSYDGSMEKLSHWKPPVSSLPAVLNAPNPSGPGPFPVKTAIYAAGTDLRRDDFGRTVPIRSRTVDASDFFSDFKGWKRWMRKTYWGFDMDKLPLNGRVWYPDGPGPFPLVLIVHGNHNMTEFSDPGYAYLGELLASRGFILVSVDENFLNSGMFHDPDRQQPVRGWLLLEHLKLWREWTAARDHPFAGKADMERIALMGHSRGGEAVATAAAFNRMSYWPEDANVRLDYRFPIRALVAIAPVDGQYKPAGAHRWIQDVSYLTLHGSHDADVSSFMGSRQWDHVRYTKPEKFFKAELWTYRANHGQFNTVWGRFDAGEPAAWILNRKPLLSGDDQRRVSKTYISAFLETTLHGKSEYRPLFADSRLGRHWLPETLFVSRYRDASFTPLASYDEDADLTTTTAPGGVIAGEKLSIWKEARIPWRRGDRDYNGVFLGWNRTRDPSVPSYTITLPVDAAAHWKLANDSTLELSIAALDEDAPDPGKKKDSTMKKEKKKDENKERESPDFTIEFTTRDGHSAEVPASHFQPIPPPLKEKLTKLNLVNSQWYGKDWEPVFQTVLIPLGSLNIDPSQIRSVRLKFDRTPSSVICVSSVGFGKMLH